MARKTTTLHKLLKVKGLTQADLCEELDLAYHSLNKVVAEARYRTKSGEIRIRECRYIREAIARWLDAPYDLVWGRYKDVFLSQLIRDEIERQSQAEKKAKLQALNLL